MTTKSILLVTCAFVGSAISVSAAEFELRMQSFWEGGTINQRAFEEFATDVEECTDGRVTIAAMPGNAVVPSTELLQATKSGILHGMQAGGALHIGQDPAFALVNDIPFGYAKPEQFLGWFHEGGGMELTQELYSKYGVHFVGPVMWGAESIPTKERIETVEDFSGVTMRSPEGIASQIWQDIGVGVSTLPGSEVYTALETGRIEATDWGGLGMNDELGFDRIASYAIYPGIHSMPAGDLAINQETWDAFSDDMKECFTTATSNLNERMLSANQELDKKAAEQRDPETLVDWSQEERGKLREIAQEHWAAWAEQNEIAQKIYESHVEYMKSLELL
ncbi:TRAP transporter substrate-binding protein DctP [Roseovarius sp.]|uniref:TRAP transporter substrate-binding protein DctP n=1 Tax=Roseovarius sp. TaxID=1486281 RepID=UPI003D118586